MDSQYTPRQERAGGGIRTFNSIERILHYHASLWKFLSSPLYGFYSIEPPAGGSIYTVWGLVFKLFRSHSPSVFPCCGWEFQLYTASTQVNG